jgi:hypothetical protein
VDGGGTEDGLVEEGSSGPEDLGVRAEEEFLVEFVGVESGFDEGVFGYLDLQLVLGQVVAGDELENARQFALALGMALQGNGQHIPLQ